MRKIIFAAVALFGMYLALMVYDAFDRMKEFSKEKAPYLHITPITRKIESPRTNFTETTPISYHHLKFNAPWGDGIEKKHKLGFEMKFPQHITLVVLGGSSFAAVWKDMPTYGIGDGKDIEKAFGKQTMNSGYLFYKRIFSAKPTFFTLFTFFPWPSWRQAPLIAKPILMPVSGKTGIFDFEINNFRGFQFGDPKRTGNISIGIESYERNNDTYGYAYNVSLSCKNITQDEIDFILSSVSTTK